MDADKFTKCRRVLVLNKKWAAVDTRTVAITIGQMMTGHAHGIDMDTMTPVPWDKWLELPVRDGEQGIHTVSRVIRVPTVIVLRSYSKVRKRRLHFSPKNLWIRDGGRCQYTGKALTPHEASIDHVHPISRGGRTTWDNCVLAHKDVNRVKANRTPVEAGMRLLTTPAPPAEQTPGNLIKRTHGHPDWSLFL